MAIRRTAKQQLFLDIETRAAYIEIFISVEEVYTLVVAYLCAYNLPK